MNTRVGCHVLFQGDLPDPGIKPRSLMSPALSGRFFTTSATLKWVNIMCKLESTEWGWERSNQACHIHIFSRFLCRASDMRQSKKLTLIGLALSAVKILPAMRETWVRSLGWEDLRGERLPTPVFWPGEFQGPYSPWDHKELDTTEQLSLHFTSLEHY